MRERLQKFLARSGVASRRKSEALIRAGRVSVNGSVVAELGTTIDASKDKIAVDGRIVTPPSNLRYVVLNKPVGYVCTRAKFRGEHTVYELVPDSEALIIAGRLDKDSEGLVLLTNDGELVNRLTHPKYEHEKEYEVSVERPIEDREIHTLKTGIPLDEGLAVADRVEVVAPKTFRMVLHQGWNRQIRRMLGALGHKVVRLQRVRMGNITLGNLTPGAYRELEKTRILQKTNT